MAQDAAGGCERIRDELIRNDVRLIASLPDDWVSPLIEVIAQDERLTHVPVARESEIIGVCCGAFFGGHNAVGLMGMAGFLTTQHELGTLALPCGIPLTMLISDRGGLDDRRIYQVYQGLVGVPIMDAMGIPHYVLDDVNKVGLIGDGIAKARMAKRPVALLLTRDLLLGGPQSAHR